MPTRLPPYLTSGASSRAHHALLVRLQEASSSQEERDIISKEAERIKEVLASNLSTAKVAEALIVLLHINVMRTDPSDDLDFAMIHALQLAERSKVIQERRIGYLFIQERMREGDELSLMVINTIRKDLSSEETPRILMALHAIVKMPFRDLSPAVTPVLTSRRLLKHASSAVRQRVLEAIHALHVYPGQEDFPLSMSKIVRALSNEDDDGVISAILRLIEALIMLDIHRINSPEEASFLAEQVSIIAEERQAGTAQLGLQSLRLLSILSDHRYGADCSTPVRRILQALLPNLDIGRTRDGAIAFEVCRLIGSGSPVDVSMSSLVVEKLRSALRPVDAGPSHGLHNVGPNSHLAVLRCLAVLPLETWDGQLGESEMGSIMDGLDNPDPTIRRSTLRLLAGQSPDLLDVSFERYLTALRDSSGLSLPLDPPATFDEKATVGRLETAARALEVAEIRAFRQLRNAGDHAIPGNTFGRSFVEILQSLNLGVVSSSLGSSGIGTGGQVWEEGLRRVVDILRGPSTGASQAGFVETSPRFKLAFLKEVLEHRIGSATLAVLRCSLLAEMHLDADVAGSAVATLLKDLKHFGPSVQELILLALLSVLSLTTYNQGQVVEAIRAVQLEAGKYIKKRGGQVIDVLQHNLLSEVMTSAASRSLPDILAAMTEVHSTWRRLQRSNKGSTPTTPVSPPTSSKHGPATLRYDSYAKPGHSSMSPLRGRLRTNEIGSPSSRRNDGSISAGDLALFDADDETLRSSDSTPFRDHGDARRTPSKARPVSLAIPSDDTTGMDASALDEARTPTMSGSSRVQSMGGI